MTLRKMTVGLELTTEATSAEYASAQRNRDVLSVISKDDRARLAGMFAVAVRSGVSAGKVIGYGPTREDAVLMAGSQPEYNRIDCAVQYITVSADQETDVERSP